MHRISQHSATARSLKISTLPVVAGLHDSDPPTTLKHKLQETSWILRILRSQSPRNTNNHIYLDSTHSNTGQLTYKKDRIIFWPNLPTTELVPARGSSGALKSAWVPSKRVVNLSNKHDQIIQHRAIKTHDWLRPRPFVLCHGIPCARVFRQVAGWLGDAVPRKRGKGVEQPQQKTSSYIFVDSLDHSSSLLTTGCNPLFVLWQNQRWTHTQHLQIWLPKVLFLYHLLRLR